MHVLVLSQAVLCLMSCCPPAYGNENGLREAMAKSVDLVGDSVMKKELSALQVPFNSCWMVDQNVDGQRKAFFQEIDLDTDMYYFGLAELTAALDKVCWRRVLEVVEWLLTSMVARVL
jgi:hypothetical protein